MKLIAGLGFNFFVVIAALSGCNPSADYALVGNAFVPSAHGDIRIERIDKYRKLIVLTMDHLPPAQRIEPGIEHYVVWFTEVGALPVRQGTLEYDAETRVGRASIPTSMLQFDVQITAENSDTPVRPSDLVVASQRIREK